MSIKNYFIICTILAILVLSMVAPAVTASYAINNGYTNHITIDRNWESKIPKELLESFDEKTDYKFAVAGFDNAVMIPMYEGSKPVIVTGQLDSLDYVKSIVDKVRYVIPMPNGAFVAYVQATKDQVIQLAKNPGITSILPSPRLIDILKPETEKIKAMNDGMALASAPNNGGDQYLAGVKVLGGVDTWEEFGITGEGVIVGVIDTGVDFSNPELGYDALARDESGAPLTMIMDEQIVLMKTVAVRNETGYLNTTNATVVFYSTLYSGLFGFPIIFYTIIDRDWYVGNITSQSGYYKIGISETIYIDWTTGYIIAIRVPVIMVDTQVPGVYDTVVFDLSTGFYELSELMRYLENETLGTILWREPDPAWLDYSFADEPMFTIGNEIIARDFDNDSLADFSLGIISGYYLDTFGLARCTVNWTTMEIYPGDPGVYPGLDAEGEYFVVFSDFYGHGTSVATVIGARGNLEYHVYGGENTTQKLYGIAPDAKIAGGAGWWVGSLWPVEFWLSGWDWIYVPEEQALYPVPSAVHRADILSNSWSYVNLARWAHQFPGSDYWSSMFDMMIVFNLLQGNNVTVVFAAGNDGPGYSTITSPGADLLIIEVGASTLFEYYQIFGYPPGYANDIIPFSSRGPNALGYPKPDVLAIGAYEWAGIRVNDGRGYGVYGYSWYGLIFGLDLFGGTSEATPFTSGSLALAIQAFRMKYNRTPTPIELKVLAKSAAEDVGYPGLQQGSGRINAYKMVKTILEDGFIAYIREGIFNAYLENYYNYYGGLAYAIASMLADTAHYDIIAPGESSTFNLVLEGYGDVEITTETFVKIKEITLFDGVYDFNHSEYLFIPRWLFRDADFIEIYVAYQNLTYPFPQFRQLPNTMDQMIRVDVFDYVDGMMYRMNTEARISTEAYITVGNVQERVKGDLLVRLRPYIAGVTPVTAKVVARMYKKVPCSLITFNTTSLFVNGTATVPATISIPEDFTPGVYDFKIIVYTPDKKIVLPVSVVVPLVLDDKSSVFLGARKSSRSYDPFTPMGLADPFYGVYTESLDWRMIPVVVSDPSIAGVYMISRWSTGYATSLEVLVVPPGGAYLPDGRDQSFAAFKLGPNVGHVYNPSLTDQYHGRLRLYIPVKWSLPLRDFVLWYYYRVIPTDYYIYEYWDYIFYNKPAFQPGLYRIFITYGSYSGWKIHDPVGIRLVVVRSMSTTSYMPDNSNAVLVTTTYKAAAYAPFLYAAVYVFSNVSYTVYGGEYTLAPLGIYGVYGGNYYGVYPIHYDYGYYLGYSIVGTELTVSYYVETESLPAEIDTALITWEYPWHASGFYYYNTTGGYLIKGEILYGAVISSSIILTGG